ncbi:hypothetical protein ACXM1Z_09840 [Staphylococcus capitis]
MKKQKLLDSHAKSRDSHATDIEEDKEVEEDKEIDKEDVFKTPILIVRTEIKYEIDKENIANKRI